MAKTDFLSSFSKRLNIVFEFYNRKCFLFVNNIWFLFLFFQNHIENIFFDKETIFSNENRLFSRIKGFFLRVIKGTVPQHFYPKDDWNPKDFRIGFDFSEMFRMENSKILTSRWSFVTVESNIPSVVNTFYKSLLLLILCILYLAKFTHTYRKIQAINSCLIWRISPISYILKEEKIS